nr:hypothetical protein Iba_chr01bCG5280 [Ipomoea batatas]
MGGEKPLLCPVKLVAEKKIEAFLSPPRFPAADERRGGRTKELPRLCPAAAYCRRSPTSAPTAVKPQPESQGADATPRYILMLQLCFDKREAENGMKKRKIEDCLSCGKWWRPPSSPAAVQRREQSIGFLRQQRREQPPASSIPRFLIGGSKDRSNPDVPTQASSSPLEVSCVRRREETADVQRGTMVAATEELAADILVHSSSRFQEASFTFGAP